MLFVLLETSFGCSDKWGRGKGAGGVGVGAGKGQFYSSCSYCSSPSARSSSVLEYVCCLLFVLLETSFGCKDKWGRGKGAGGMGRGGGRGSSILVVVLVLLLAHLRCRGLFVVCFAGDFVRVRG